MHIQKTTYYVNNNSLALGTVNKLTCYVNKSVENKFPKWIGELIAESGLVGKVVAEKAGIKAGSLSRIFSGEAGIKKETAIALMEAINKMTGRETANLNTGLALWAGIELPPAVNVPDFIKAIDFSMFSESDLKDIETFLNYKIHQTGRTVKDALIINDEDAAKLDARIRQEVDKTGANTVEDAKEKWRKRKEKEKNGKQAA